MEIESIITDDGSSTLYVPAMDEHYHSTHGAINEAKHVYIEAALNACHLQHLVVFEMGLGTGLNAYLTAQEAEKRNIQVLYWGIDNFKISAPLFNELSYAREVEPIQQAPWNEDVIISPHFTLHKVYAPMETYCHTQNYDVIFFDAFAPNKQNILWTLPIFEQLFQHTNPQGILTTYCAKGAVRRMLQAAGYSVERIAGPLGKREMLRGIRQCT